MAINPFEVAKKYGYSQEDFANDPNFEGYWSGKSEQDLIGGLQGRSDYGKRIGGLTRVSDPSALSGLTEQQIVRDPNSDNIYYAAGYQPQAQPSLNVPQATPEIDVAQGVTSIADVSTGIPETAPNVSAIQNQMTDIEKLKQQYTQQLQQITADRMSRAEEEKTRLTDELTELSEFDQEAKLRDLYAEQGLQDRITEFDNISTELQDLYTQYFEQDAAVKGKPLNQTFVTADRRKLADQFNAKSAGLQMRASILSDNYNRAKGIADNYFTSAVNTNNTQIANYNNLLNLNNQEIIRLNNDEKSFIGQQIENLNSINNRIENEKNTINELAINNPSIWNKAGVTLNMPLDEIVAKMAEVAPEQNVIDSLIESYPDAGITASDTLQSAQAKLQNSSKYNKEVRIVNSNNGNTEIVSNGFADVLQDALNSGMSPEEAARAAAAVSERMGIPVSQSQINGWVKLAKTMTAVIKEEVKEYEEKVIGIGDTILNKKEDVIVNPYIAKEKKTFKDVMNDINSNANNTIQIGANKPTLGIGDTGIEDFDVEELSGFYENLFGNQ